MAVDTKDKRINVMNITCRTFVGITPSGSITQNDKENFAWLYFPFSYSESVPSETTTTEKGKVFRLNAFRKKVFRNKTFRNNSFR